jgi:hypothetical protein
MKMKILCTFSGKYGDILWSLPTARHLARKYDRKVDFAVMPAYESICPLIEQQEYIEKCFVIPDWICTGSPYGDQPWQAPVQSVGMDVGVQAKIHDYRTLLTYDRVHQLTYRSHPGMGSSAALPLVDFIAWQQGLQLDTVIPFLTAKKTRAHGGCLLVAYGFNDQYENEKKQFLEALTKRAPRDVIFRNVALDSWTEAAEVLAEADLFIGCRSANWVLALGLGRETITYEPHPSRHSLGPLSKIFGCPYGNETPLPLEPETAARMAAEIIGKKREQGMKVAGVASC